MYEENVECIFNSIRFGSNMGEVEAILFKNKSATVSFEFNWETYESYIVIKGEDTQKIVKLKTPQIPLVGGAWSNLVATRCITGQIMVSAMIESVYIQLLFIVRDSCRLNTKITKIDKCFYAPLMYYTTDNNGNLISSCQIDKPNIEYSEILINQFPEQYKQIQELKGDYGIVFADEYWKLNGYK